jgi:hypothetical protein
MATEINFSVLNLKMLQTKITDLANIILRYPNF